MEIYSVASSPSLRHEYIVKYFTTLSLSLFSRSNMSLFRSSYKYLLLFLCVPIAAQAQSQSVLQVTVCITDADNSIPVADATVTGSVDESNSVSGSTGINGCTDLNIPLSVSNEDLPGAPEAFSLGSPYPNPTSGALTIPFSLSNAEAITLEIYDIQGRSISAPFSRTIAQGHHKLDISLGAMSPGIYAFRLYTASEYESGTFIKVQGGSSSGAPDIQLSAQDDWGSSELNKSVSSQIRLEVSKQDYNDLMIDMEVNDGDRVDLTLSPQNSNSNTPPVIANISDGAVQENDTLVVDVFAADGEDDPLTLSVTVNKEGVPVNTNRYTFVDFGDNTGRFEMMPIQGDAGMYDVAVTADDGQATSNESFNVDVQSTQVNTPPDLNPISDVTIPEGATNTTQFTASDAEGDALVYTLTLEAAGGGTVRNGFHTFQDMGDGTAELELATQAGDAGAYSVAVAVTDGTASVERSFMITVTSPGGNSLPVISALNDQSVAEGATLSVGVEATDADSDPISLSAGIQDGQGNDVAPGFFSFSDGGDGTGTLDVTPGNGDAGTYIATIGASDGQGNTELTFGITVESPGGNSLPVISAIDNRAVQEGNSITVTLTATDADGDPISFSVDIEDSQGSSVGSGFYVLNDNGDGNGLLTILPESGDAGVYLASVIASDGMGSTEETFNITVTEPGQTSDMIPLIDMGAQTYKGFTGGLYPNASNDMPAVHYQAGIDFANSIEPLDTNGNPSPNGKYVMVSLGMSNTTQEFCSKQGDSPCDSWTFMGQALADPELNTTSLVIVNGAKGGQSAKDWVDPNDDNYDRVVSEHLTPQGLSENQVQIAWVKVANPGPSSSLPNQDADAYILESQIAEIVRALRVRYPNLKQVFLSSRIYAGYAATVLNPEPYAYESGFSVKFLIEAQIDQMDGNGIDDVAGDMNYSGSAAWVAWGAYFWADGMNPRSDGLIWEPQDLEGDGTHPSMFGEEKVGTMLLDFFKSSPHTKCWFLENGGACQ